MKWRIIAIFLILLPVILPAQNENIIRFQGEVEFISDAPLETIRAKSYEITGLIDTSQWRFAFRVPVNSFRGFNSELQRQHFNENYLETPEFPEISYSGKLLSKPKLQQKGEYPVRTKGVFVVHGVKKERIIESTIIVDPPGVSIYSEFQVALKDHNIRIPRIVEKKISPLIDIQFNVENELKN